LNDWCLRRLRRSPLGFLCLARGAFDPSLRELLHRASRRLRLPSRGRILGSRRAHELLDLLGGQFAPLADGQPLQAQRAEARAAELLHWVAELDHQRPNLDIPVLAQGHVNHRLVAVAADEAQRTAHRLTIGLRARTEHLALERRDAALIEASLEGQVVTLLDEIAGVRQPVRKRAVVGEQDEARTVEIEPAHAVEPGSARVTNEVDRAWAPLGVAVRAYRSARLEEHDVDMLLRRPERASVHLDAVVRWVREGGQRVDDLPVDGDRAGEDQFLALAPGRGSCIGQDPLQSHSARTVHELAADRGVATGLARK
jgi:hypothetical protein